MADIIRVLELLGMSVLVIMAVVAVYVLYKIINYPTDID